MTLKSESQCHYPGCTNTRRTRGLCHGHYQAARAYVRQGKVTELELLRRQMMTAPGKGGAPSIGNELLLEPTARGRCLD